MGAGAKDEPDLLSAGPSRGVGAALVFSTVNRVCTVFLNGRLTAKIGGFRPGQWCSTTGLRLGMRWMGYFASLRSPADPEQCRDARRGLQLRPEARVTDFEPDERVESGRERVVQLDVLGQAFASPCCATHMALCFVMRSPLG